MPPLVKPSLVNASPGQPLTAQAWNAVLAAVGALYDAFATFGTATVEVQLTGPSGPVTNAVVVAVPTSGAPVEAVSPRAGNTAYVLTRLLDGNWTVHVSAPGFAPLQAPLTIPTSAPLQLNLTANTKVMPDLIGTTATNALSKLAADGIQVEALFDTIGEEVSRTTLPANRANARVLFQFPVPGTAVTAATAKVRLVLAAIPDTDTTVRMPNLIGMSYEEAAQVLTDLGLRVGRVNTNTR